MKKEILKNWLRLACAIICGIAALILLMAEPNECDTFGKWLCVLVSTKIGALVCGIFAYCVIENLTEEIKK